MCDAGCLCPDGGSPPPDYEVSKELWRPSVENEVSDVYSALVFVKCGNTLNAIGDVELTRDKTGDGFGFPGPEMICPGIGYGVDDASGERKETVGCEVVFASGGKPKKFRIFEGANEGGFFAFNYSDWFERVGSKEVFAKKALPKTEVRRNFSL